MALDAALPRKADRAAAIAACKHVEEEFEEYRIPTYRPAAGESPAR